MHELPPMVHKGPAGRARRAPPILPRTGRLHPDAGRLLAAASAVGRGRRRDPLAGAHDAPRVRSPLPGRGGRRRASGPGGHRRPAQARRGPPTGSGRLCAMKPRRLDCSARVLRPHGGWPDPGHAGTGGRGAWHGPLGAARYGRSDDDQADRCDAGERRPPAGHCAWALYIRSHWLRMPPQQLRSLAQKGRSQKCQVSGAKCQVEC